MKNRTTAYKRHKDYTKSKRLQNIKKHVHGYDMPRGRLVKGKVHCSCPMCSTKTKYRGLKRQDKRGIDEMNSKLREWERGL